MKFIWVDRSASRQIRRNTKWIKIWNRPKKMSISRAANFRCLGMKREKGSRRPSWRGTLKSGKLICFTGTFDAVSSAKRFTIAGAICCRDSGCKCIKKAKFIYKYSYTTAEMFFLRSSLSSFLRTIAQRKEINLVLRTISENSCIWEMRIKEIWVFKKNLFKKRIKNFTFPERRALRDLRLNFNRYD